MEGDETSPLRSLIAANDSETPPIDTARIEAALIGIARLIGRQIARDGFEARSQ